MNRLAPICAFAALVAFAVALFAWLDATIATATYGLGFSQILGFALLGLHTMLSTFLGPIIISVVWVTGLFLRPNSERHRGWIALPVIASAAAAVAVYLKLAEYTPFEAYLPFIASVIFWGVILIGLYVVVTRFDQRWQKTALGIVVLIVGIAIAIANYHLFRGLYPVLHEATVMVALITFVLGCVLSAHNLASRSPKSGVVFAIVSLTILVGFDTPKSTVQKFRHFSELGRVLPSEPKSLSTQHADLAPDPDGVKRFLDATGFPELPEHFAIDDYNILLIGVEATRYDRTSLSKRFKTTPHLARWAPSGVVVHRAYAPSSGTLHSLSALLTMKYPSSIAMTTWMKPWNGELSAVELTVPELLRDSRYETWWIGHNYNEGFSNSILGLNQGFDVADLFVEYEDGKQPQNDALISRHALKKLQTYVEQPDKKFFGFVFFGAPHAPYLTHSYKGMPASSEHQRYLQEIRFADEQFGALMNHLESSKLLERTVVIFFSDHGEEFREHGGVRHKSTVYREVLHVPLVLWIPGVNGETQAPASTNYVFPYLFQTARDDGLRTTIENHLKNYWGPMLRETNNAVAAELIGHDRIKATLISPEYKLNHDYRSGLTRLFHFSKDPAERRDVFEQSDHQTARDDMTKRLDGFNNARDVFFKHAFEPEKVTPPNSRELAREKKK